MKIDITSLCFGFKIEKDNDSGTAAWATSIGQAPKGICYIDTNREGLDEIVYGMMYKSHSDFENLKVRDVEGLDKREEPRGDRERMMFSVFDNVYVNNKKVEGIYTLSYEREDSSNHKNRLHICYAKYLTYKGHSNKKTLKEMSKVLGCSDDACWFVYDISIKNQDELHFSAIIVDKDNFKVYSTSKQRAQEWNGLLKEHISSKKDIKYTIDELAAILKTTYNNGAKTEESVAQLFYFGLNYGEYILKSNFNTHDIVQKAGLKKNLNQELNKSLKLYLLIKRKGLQIRNKTNNYCESDYLQQIYYGAPGTGKSNEIKLLTAEGGKFCKDFTFRTTFHPDSDYSSFVGAYKPIWSDEKEKIVYEFRPQAFLKAYVAAWTHPEEQVALVVEEINRGNCAQIFGDIFQLLDRHDNGLSKYPIESDVDMQKFLFDALNDNIKEDWAGNIPETNTEVINDCYAKHYNDAFKKIKEGKILALPKNLSILATMNTSDQSLFPMDSAFKRRWDWKYQPIVKGVDSETRKELDWKIIIDGYNPIDWWEFIDRINKVIFDLTSSEDKQLGYFFCMPESEGETTISAERFVEKVIFYLWNDVFKDYSYDPECCNKKDKKDEKVKYSDFYTTDGKDIEKGVLAYFINQLKTKDGEVDHMAKKSKDVEDAGNDSGAGMGEESGAQDNSIDALPQGSLF